MSIVACEWGGADAVGAQLGGSSWLLVDAQPEAGGLSSTYRTPEGFLYDLGGHVIFSHYQVSGRAAERARSAHAWRAQHFDDVLRDVVGDEERCWNKHKRGSHVYLDGRYVPYPFQLNLHRLSPAHQLRCLDGLVDARPQGGLGGGVDAVELARVAPGVALVAGGGEGVLAHRDAAQLDHVGEELDLEGLEHLARDAR